MAPEITKVRQTVGLGKVIATLALALLVGCAVTTVILSLQDSGYKAWVVVIAMVLAPVAVAITRRPKELLLFGWVVSLTYNRQYYVFSPLVGYNGTQGPYVMLSDVCLVALLAWWGYEKILGRPDDRPRGTPLWPWYAPFAGVCLLSIFDSARPDWGAYEMIRILKVGLVLFYIRRNFGRKEWKLALAGLAFAVSFQSAVAMKEVITGKAGVIGASEVAGAPAFIEHFAEGAFTGQVVRGTGTLSHPPYLACYLLLALPVLLALALAAPRRRAVWMGLAFLFGCGGLAATLSRGPWALAGAEFVLVLLALTMLRLLPVQRALGLSIAAGFLLMLGLIPVKDKLMDRLTGDFTESVRYRQAGIDASFAAIADHPFLGLGLNNTELYIGKYLPEMEWGLVTEEFAANTLHLRAPIALGNGFLHVAEETGLLGLGAFALFAFGVLIIGIRSVAWTAGEQQAVCVAMVIGILGALGEQLVDTPLWVDPVLFTFALYTGLLSIAAPLFVRLPARTPAPRLDLAA